MLLRFLTYLKKEPGKAAVAVAEPFFYRQYLHQVVSQGDCQNWDSGYIEHGVELNKCTHHRDSCKVLVKSFGVNSTREHCWRCFTTVRQSTESIPRELSLNKKHNCAEDITNQEHFWECTLGSYWVDDSGD